MSIGKTIRETRIELGISQVDLAKRVGISKELLYRYESGKIDTIPYPKLVAIADALHISPGYLMGWEDIDGNSVNNATPAEDPKLTKFKGLVEQLSDEDLHKVYELAQLLLMAEKNNKKD